MFDLGANSTRLLQIFDSATSARREADTLNADRQLVWSGVGTVTKLYHVNEFDSAKFGYRARVQSAKACRTTEESCLSPEMSFAYRQQAFVSPSRTSECPAFLYNTGLFYSQKDVFVGTQLKFSYVTGF